MNAAALLAASCLALLPQRTAALAQPAARAVVLGYVLPDSTDPRQLAFDRGARLGIAEARRAALLLRRELTVIELSSRTPDPATEARLERAGAGVIVAPALPEPFAARLTRWFAQPGRAIVAGSAVSPASCAIPLFRVGPDSGLRVRIATASDAGASAASGHREEGRPPPSRVELWHHGLQRFGARQLSDRYAERYGTPMTSAAWEGWMAVKAAWESAVRARDGNVATVLERGAFDGHKGTALRFDPNDRILRQPLILVSADTTSHDQPEPDTLVKGLTPTSIREVAWPADRSPRGDSTGPVGSCRR